MDAPEEIINDEEIARVHGYANFGSMTPRQVVADGILKYAFGYSSGHTQLCILLEHGLIRKPKPGSYQSTLTKKGQSYLRAAWPIFRLRAELAALEPAPDLAELVEAAKRVADQDAKPEHPGRYEKLRQTIDGLRAALAKIKEAQHG